jgi:hypothetical protein
VTVTGTGNYTGRITQNFEILPVSITECTIGAISDYPYTGKAVSPKLTITYAGQSLVKDRDYTVKCASVEAGDATVTVTGQGNYRDSVEKSFRIVEAKKNPAVGTRLSDAKSGGIYTVASADASGAATVTYAAPVDKNKTSVTIPSTVTINGVTYKVTAIAKNAFKNNKKLKKAVIGSNIAKIGANAFYGCKNLKQITIKTTQLTTKNVGSKAFKGISSTATIKVPKSVLKSYQKLLRKKGVGSKVKIKK